MRGGGIFLKGVVTLKSSPNPRRKNSEKKLGLGGSSLRF